MLTTSNLNQVMRHQGKSAAWQEGEHNYIIHVFTDMYEDPTGGSPVMLVSKIFIQDNARVEVPLLNWMYDQDAIVGMVRFRFTGYDSNRRRLVEVNPTLGVYGAALEYVKAYFRKHAMIVVGKVKSKKDVLYLWKDPHKGTIPEWAGLLSAGKMFKEFQRYIGNRVLLHDGSVRVLFYNADEDAKAVGLDIKEAGDGGCYMSHSVASIFGERDVLLDALGIRILNWKSGTKSITTCKGKADTNQSEFNRICDTFNIDPNTVDLVIPLVNLKVSTGIEAGDIVTLPQENFRLISYIDPKRQNMGSLNLVTTVTLQQYAGIICELIDRHAPHLDEDVAILKGVMAGDTAAYSKLVSKGTNSSVNAEVCGLAFPIWKDGAWRMPRLNDYINYLFDRVAAYYRQHIRKVKLVGGLNRRAAYSRQVELWNKDNKTGAYIVKFHKQSLYVPQEVMVCRTLGDYDGDNLTACKISNGVYLIWRYPIVGPNSMFIGIEKGKTVQDVPEWARPLVNAHKKMPIPAAAPKGDKPVITTFTEGVDEFYNQLTNALAASPLLGQCTNRLIRNNIHRVVNNCPINHAALAKEAADLENKAVKSIKSNLDTSEDALSSQKHQQLLAQVNILDTDNPKLYQILNTISMRFEKYNQTKQNEIFDIQYNDDTDPLQRAVWDMCSKASNTSKKLMEILVTNTNYVYENKPELATTIPIVRALQEFINFDITSMVTPDASDAVDMAHICSYITKNRYTFGFDGDIATINRITNDIKDINFMTTIFVPVRNLDKIAMSKLVDVAERARAHILNNNVTGDKRRELMVKFARTVIYATMGLLEYKDPSQMDVNLPLQMFRNRTDQYGRFLSSSDVKAGVMNIEDEDLRSFVFSALSSYMRWYIKDSLDRTIDRFHLMLNIGTTSFYESKRKVASPRLWNLCYSAIPTSNEDVEALHYCSSIWCEAVLKFNELDSNIKAPDFDDDMYERCIEVNNSFEEGFINDFNQYNAAIDDDELGDIFG